MMIIMLRHYSWSLVGLSIVGLTGCAQSSKAIESLQTKILEDVVRQGGSSLKSVVCPSDKAQEASFDCLGVLESGSGFDIPVKLQDDQSHSWSIVSIKGLLNMSQLQAAIQSGLGAEIGDPQIDCGTTTAYKAAKPGEQFECKVEGIKLAAAPKPSDSAKPSDVPAAKADNASTRPAADKTKSEKTVGKVMVTIASSGDISWQRILPEGKDKLAEKAKLGTNGSVTPDKDGVTPSQAVATDAPPDTTATKADITPAPPSANKSAEAAVNAGAFDAAED
jgi:hypothetical protein